VDTTATLQSITQLDHFPLNKHEHRYYATQPSRTLHKIAMRPPHSLSLSDLKSCRSPGRPVHCSAALNQKTQLHQRELLAHLTAASPTKCHAPPTRHACSPTAIQSSAHCSDALPHSMLQPTLKTSGSPLAGPLTHSSTTHNSRPQSHQPELLARS
jgi:hypothetical protein